MKKLILTIATLTMLSVSCGAWDFVADSGHKGHMVQWTLYFSPDGSDSWQKIAKSKSFASQKKALDFISKKPHEVNIFECEENGEHGRCMVMDAEIRS